LYQGIAARTFERSCQLADYVQVKGASLENGLLHVDLVGKIPEAMKPRAVPIASSSKRLEVKPSKVAAWGSDKFWGRAGFRGAFGLTGRDEKRLILRAA